MFQLVADDSPCGSLAAVQHTYPEDRLHLRQPSAQYAFTGWSPDLRADNEGIDFRRAA
jgi:hypothetical protein